MEEIYKETILTPLGVAKTTGFLDWDTQPSPFKHYPEFLFGYDFGKIEALKIIELSRSVTDAQQLGKKPYYRLNTPSAGNLHPTELYVQIRGVEGVLSGIYHIDAKDACLVLIEEIEKEGIEPYVGLRHRFKGMLFVVSMVPFRSEWKYGKRAWRYCYLDAGHQAGSVLAAASATGQNATILSDIDSEGLHTVLGFSDEEYPVVALGIGEESERGVVHLKKALMHVCPLDYSEGTRDASAYLLAPKISDAKGHRPEKIEEETILGRRSARRFGTEVLSKETADFVASLLQEVPEPLHAWQIWMHHPSRPDGIYRDGICVDRGEYAKLVCRMLVDQYFIAEASVVVILTTDAFGPGALLGAGIFVQRVYLEAAQKGLGVTGIGAYYDLKLQQFLGTDEAILYVAVIGAV